MGTGSGSEGHPAKPDAPGQRSGHPYPETQLVKIACLLLPPETLPRRRGVLVIERVGLISLVSAPEGPDETSPGPFLFSHLGISQVPTVCIRNYLSMLPRDTFLVLRVVRYMLSCRTRWIGALGGDFLKNFR